MPPPKPSSEPAEIDHRRLETARDLVGPAPPSRWWLRLSAATLRGLNYLGMILHFRIDERPPNPSFTRPIPSTLSQTKGDFTLQLYTPKGYADAAASGTTFPAVINFHGGGFTIGSATDDARFARYITDECKAVFISVDYRLSPEYPFPVPVDDAADALLYVIRSAAALHIDPLRLATCGFSAGGNLAFTSLLRLTDHLASLKKTPPSAATEEPPVPNHRFLAVVSWYPITDYTIPRSSKRASCPRPDLTLPAQLTTLFDAAYLADPAIDLSNPYLSPACATDEQLNAAIPQTVILHTCEWDMLLEEGREMVGRLREEPLNREVVYKLLDETQHAWDKAARFGSERDLELVHYSYVRCCWELEAVFEGRARREGGEGDAEE
ncbi:Alpha/Beta hydrolase protein [Staphylotrichum tortipilum]|uniref:Alpha/Beta hydrolase protein n=1 Tax=Staphylotrichum tortipilum TaxID=2831512 RepID=A0AAN6RQA8_9PEZI|nr:Alpha/Beta hydrolase protein [Staphylotrichum longicolle]